MHTSLDLSAALVEIGTDVFVFVVLQIVADVGNGAVVAEVESGGDCDD